MAGLKKTELRDANWEFRENKSELQDKAQNSEKMSEMIDVNLEFRGKNATVKN